MMRKDNFLRRKNSFGNLFLAFFIEVSVLYKIHHSNFINEQFSKSYKKKIVLSHLSNSGYIIF